MKAKLATGLLIQAVVLGCSGVVPSREAPAPRRIGKVSSHRAVQCGDVASWQRQGPRATRLADCPVSSLSSLFADGHWVRIDHILDHGNLVLGEWIGPDELLVIQRGSVEWKATRLCDDDLREPFRMAATAIGGGEVLAAVDQGRDPPDVIILGSADRGKKWNLRGCITKPDTIWAARAFFSVFDRDFVELIVTTPESRAHFLTKNAGHSWTNLEHCRGSHSRMDPLLIEAPTESHLVEFLAGVPEDDVTPGIGAADLVDPILGG